MILYKVAREFSESNKDFRSAVVVESELQVHYEIGEEAEAPCGYLFCFKDLNKARQWVNDRKHGTAYRQVILKCESITPPRPLGWVLAINAYGYRLLTVAPRFWGLSSSKRRSGFRHSPVPAGTYGVKKLRVLEIVEVIDDSI